MGPTSVASILNSGTVGGQGGSSRGPAVVRQISSELIPGEKRKNMSHQRRNQRKKKIRYRTMVRIGGSRAFVEGLGVRRKRDRVLSVKDIDVYDVHWHVDALFEFLCHRLLKYGIFSDEANIVSESIGSNSSSNRREHLFV